MNSFTRGTWKQTGFFSILSTLLGMGIGFICSHFPPNWWTFPIVVWLIIALVLSIVGTLANLVRTLQK